jgi:hypothetical protein
MVRIGLVVQIAGFGWWRCEEKTGQNLLPGHKNKLRGYLCGTWLG